MDLETNIARRTQVKKTDEASFERSVSLETTTFSLTAVVVNIARFCTLSCTKTSLIAPLGSTEKRIRLTTEERRALEAQGINSPLGPLEETE